MEFGELGCKVQANFHQLEINRLIRGGVSDTSHYGYRNVIENVGDA